MIQTIFFDVGGVLGAPAVSTLYQELAKSYPALSRERFLALLSDVRVLTGEKGTLDSLLTTDYGDLGINATPVLDAFSRLPFYNENFLFARSLKQGGYRVGILSDQIAESASSLRQVPDFEDIFDPILFSPEINLTKKDRRIFDQAQRIVDSNFSHLLMIDDHESVLAIAREAGWQGLLYTYPSKLSEQLKEYLL